MLHRVYSATTGGEGGRRGHNGGVWGWTSTEFDEYKGFVPLSLYLGFSADFIDTLHNVVNATRCATSSSVIILTWIGGRIAYDIAK